MKKKQQERHNNITISNSSNTSDNISNNSDNNTNPCWNERSARASEASSVREAITAQKQTCALSLVS